MLRRSCVSVFVCVAVAGCFVGCFAGRAPGDVGFGADAGFADVTDAGFFDDADTGGCDDVNADSGLDARPANTTCTAPARPPRGGVVDTFEPWPNLHVPEALWLVEEPGTDLMYVMTRDGRVVRFDKNDADVDAAEPWMDISDRVRSSEVGSNAEAGAYGFVFHPRWPDVAEIFVIYLGGRRDDEPFSDNLSRFTLDSDGTVDEGSEEILLSIGDYSVQHNADTVRFGPDGYLYLSIGDGGGFDGAGDDPFDNAQDLSVLLGKMLRIDVDHEGVDTAYAIPGDNPFVGVPGARGEIWAYGLRNPYRFSFDRDSGQLWLGDVGDEGFEEVDVIVKGGNYGWDVFEGNACFVDSHGESKDCAAGGFVAPELAYAQAGGRGVVVGGFVYRGADMPSLRGVYLWGDFKSGEILALQHDAQGAAELDVVYDDDIHVTAVGEDEDGELYYVDHSSGTIKKLIEAGDPVVDTFPQKLSETGCVDVADPRRPASGVLPYRVNHKLWSDGARKERFLAIPDGTRLTVGVDGDIVAPIGTVLLKTFYVDDAPIETRLFVRHDDGEWGGYSYAWDDDGTDAALLPPAGAARVLPNGQTWTWPARNQCMTCHSAAAGRSLGLELAQLNGGFVYGDGVCANQLQTWIAAGVLDHTLTDRPEKLAKLPAVDDENVDVGERARAYLHVNCSNCHRPGGPGRGPADFRVAVPFSGVDVCDEPPTEGNLGVDGARLLVPGDPARSLISLRMHRADAARMPEIGSAIVDARGTTLIDRWISELPGCP